jgi:Flp pilus assembly protein TadG
VAPVDRGQMVRRFGQDLKGNIALMALGLVAVATLVGGGIVDYMSLTTQQQRLQGVADRAAIAAAQELVVFKGSDGRMSAVAEAFVKSSYTDDEPPATSARVVEDGKAVEVTLTAEPNTYFPGPIAQGVSKVQAVATAEVSGGGYVCMVGLSTNEDSTLDMHDKARVTATNCAIYSNSKNKNSLRLASNARVKADLVCVAGGVAGPMSAVSPNEPLTDCPQLADPLRSRPEPNVGLLTCTNILGSGSILGKDLLGKDGKLLDLKNLLGKKGLIGGVLRGELLEKKNLLQSITQGDLVGNLAPGLIVTGKTTLEPGVYCGGINIIGGDVKLKPGTYILNNGGLNVMNGGKLVGEQVGFYLTGALGLSTVQLAPSSTVSLTAPRSGDMSGMLFFEDRKVLFKFPHIFASNDARSLVGTIYLPGNTLEINSQKPIADQSDYTVIIARKFDMKDGPELVLNTDYENSLVPVPEGVGNKSRPMVKLAPRT